MTTDWREIAFRYAALPEVGALFLAATPAFVWSRDGERLLWANPAGARVLGGKTFAALSERRWAEGHPLRRTIESLSRTLGEQGMLARLRLTDDLPALPVLCRCRSVRAGGERAVLVVATEMTGRSASPEALVSFLSAPDGTAALFDPTGALLAEARPGVGASVTPATPSVVFSDGGRMLRLALVERAEAPARVSSSAQRSARVVDDPGLSLLANDVTPPQKRAPLLEPDMREAPPTIVVRAEPVPAPPPPPSDTASALETPRPSAPERNEPSPPAVEAPDADASQGDGGEAETSSARSVMAGRVPRELARKPVRFLWQTDAADRYLFVSPGLQQVVGRNAEIVGERWQEASARLRLDPSGRIARALRQRDTWSGLTAWWPIEGSNVRVPVELTALPVFGGDNSFQGYRGFGILRPAEALMPAAFETRFGAASVVAEQIPPYEEAAGTAPANVVPIRADIDRRAELPRLTEEERSAFEEIAAELRNRVVGPLRGRAEPPPLAPKIEDLPRARPLGETASEAAKPPAETPRAAAAKSEPPSEPKLPPQPKLPPDPKSAPATGGQLADVQRRLREMTAILDTATDGVVILDGDGVIESVNASAEALFGLEASEMEGRKFADLLAPESRTSALDYLSGLRDSGVASLLNEGREVEAKAGLGTIPLFMTVGRMSSGEGGRFCAVLRDITHWKRIEAELTGAKQAAERASNQKSDFLARVSHEVRTPLNAIIGFAEVMIEERFGPIENERYREYLRDIRTSGEHVVSLVNDLLDISKIEAGKLDLHFSAVPLNEMVQESIGLMQPQANRARVVLRTSLSREVPAVVADARTLRQIILNLLSNSVKFTSPGGQVIASTSLSPTGEALLRIRDTGEGMTEEELVRALEPFRQLATASLSDRTGTGLGLPLTKALVEANRATLSIKSARGEGTVVTITIPPTRVLSE